MPSISAVADASQEKTVMKTMMTEFLATKYFAPDTGADGYDTAKRNVPAYKTPASMFDSTDVSDQAGSGAVSA